MITIPMTVETSIVDIPMEVNVSNQAVEMEVDGSISYSRSNLQTKEVSYTPTESGTSAVVLPDSEYDGLGEVDIEVSGIPATYVGSEIPRRTSTDLTASGATVTAPAGYYDDPVSKAVASGSEGIPVAAKGSVSNHRISVTPSVTNTAGYISGGTKTGDPVTVAASELVSGTRTISDNGSNIDVTNYEKVTVNVNPSLQTKSKTYSPSESSQTDTITTDSGYYGLEEVDITINPISSTYVGSGITRRSSTDLTASGATITAPAGYYSDQASKAVASGTAGTPTATKGTVSNNSISVTPKVTNATGYITGGTKTGTAVTVSASELVSGNRNITANGTNIDVTNYETVSVAVPGESPNLQTKTKTYTPSESTQTETVTPDSGYDGLDEVGITVNAISSTYVGSGITRRSSSDLTASGATVTVPSGYYSAQASKAVSSGSAGTPTASKGSVSNHSISVTPSVTNTTGYITGGTKTGTAVTVSASELVSGNKSITANGTNIDVTNYETVSVALPVKTYYTGTSAPSASLGNDGDLYFQK